MRGYSSLLDTGLRYLMDSESSISRERCLTLTTVNWNLELDKIAWKNNRMPLIFPTPTHDPGYYGNYFAEVLAMMPEA